MARLPASTGSRFGGVRRLEVAEQIVGWGVTIRHELGELSRRS